jgi:hypothetical protein
MPTMIAVLRMMNHHYDFTAKACRKPFSFRQMDNAKDRQCQRENAVFPVALPWFC